MSKIINTIGATVFAGAVGVAGGYYLKGQNSVELMPVADSAVVFSLDTAEGKVWNSTVPEYRAQWRAAAGEQLDRALRYIQDNPGAVVDIHCGPGGCAPIETTNEEIEYDSLEY